MEGAGCLDLIVIEARLTGLKLELIGWVLAG